MSLDDNKLRYWQPHKQDNDSYKNPPGYYGLLIATVSVPGKDIHCQWVILKKSTEVLIYDFVDTSDFKTIFTKLITPKMITDRYGMKSCL